MPALSDFTQVYQDNPPTLNVTAAGQNVRYIRDQSGRGNHMVLTAGTIQVDPLGNYYLSGAVGTTSAIDCSASNKMSIWGAYQRTGGGTDPTIASFGLTASQSGSFDFGMLNAGALLYRKGSGSQGARGGLSVGLAPVVVSASLDLAGTTQATENPALRVNGTQVVFTDYLTADTGGGNFGNYVLQIGAAASGSAFVGRLYALIIRAAATADLTGAEGVCAARIGNPLTPIAFTDSGPIVPTAGWQKTSTFARTVFTTSQTSMMLTSTNNLSQNPQLGVVVNGVYNQTVGFTLGVGMEQKMITLPAGSKTVEIVNGLQSGATSGAGIWLLAAQSAGGVTQTFPTPTNRILFYGDSITAGGNATNLPGEGYVPLLRTATTRSIAAEASGLRSLRSDAVDGTARAVFITRMAAYAPTAIWLAIGTNDYGDALWNAAAFGTAYAAVLDDLHTALPSAVIYAQTPLSRSTETANGVGSTLGDYRAQIVTAVSTRTGYTTLVDGTAIMTTASMLDGLHPTTAGHLLYKNYVVTTMGL